MGRQNRRALNPGLEPMEGRQLLSSAIIIATANPNPLPSADLLSLAAAGGTGAGGGGHGGAGAGTNAGPFAPIVPGQGQPTRHELARESFRGSFTGPYSIGPGRFSDQARMIYLRGVGGSNQFRHGDVEMAVVTPVDPAAPLSGAAVLNDKSTNSGGVIGLDLVADRQSLDRLGRPGKLTITSDPNIYGGIYFVSTTSGTATIHYRSYNVGPYGYGRGVATVSIQGLIYTSGLTNPLRNTDLYANGGRVHHR